MRVADFLDLLRCPDDGAALELRDAALRCVSCARMHPLLADNAVELLPSRPFVLPPSSIPAQAAYEDAYRSLLAEPFRWTEAADRAWGYAVQQQPAYTAFLEGQWRTAERHLGRAGVACDIAAGSANYSLRLARISDVVIVLDLDVASLNTAHAVFKRAGATNALFMRADYLSLPFADGALDAVTGFDSLERGRGHDLRHLAEMRRVLRAGGRGVVDVHNRPRRRLLRVKARQNVRHYSRRELDELIRDAGIRTAATKETGFCPVSVPFGGGLYAAADMLLSVALPGSRFMVLFDGGETAGEA